MWPVPSELSTHQSEWHHMPEGWSYSQLCSFCCSHCGLWKTSCSWFQNVVITRPLQSLCVPAGLLAPLVNNCNVLPNAPILNLLSCFVRYIKAAYMSTGASVLSSSSSSSKSDGRNGKKSLVQHLSKFVSPLLHCLVIPLMFELESKTAQGDDSTLASQCSLPLLQQPNGEIHQVQKVPIQHAAVSIASLHIHILLCFLAFLEFLDVSFRKVSVWD